MVQTRLSHVRSFSSQALVWSQSRHRQARMRLPDDLAVRDLPCRTSVLPRHSARGLTLLEKAGLVDHEHRIVIRQVLDDIVPDDVAQGISVPIPATQDRLLPPWAGIASRLRPHPTGLALLISEQTYKEQPCVRRHTLLREQRTYPLLD